MKKLLILLMIGITYSFSTYASNKVKNETNKPALTMASKKLAKDQPKLYSEFCVEAQVYIGECPDGSVFVGAVGYVLSDCESGQVYGFAVDFISSADESC
jgi:hypothetical protein